MKKLTAIFCAFAITAGLIAGCGTNEDNNKGAVRSEQQAQEQVQAIDLDIAALKGPTAMGLVKFMDDVEQGKLTDNNYNFTIAAAADEISAKINSEDGFDIAAVPANLASVLYNNTQGKIDVIAINTLGVLYIVENGQNISGVEDMKGKTIYASGKGLTPEYTLNYILSENGIDPVTDVTIEWKSEHSECLSALMANENAIALLPQPFVTTAQTKSDKIRVALDLNEEWDKHEADKENPSSLITGVVVAKKSVIDENPQAISAFLDHYKESVQFTNENVEEAAKLVGKFDIVPEAVAIKAIPECNITFIEGDEMKEKLSGYLAVLNEQNPKTIGGKMPADDFYYSR